LLQGFFVVSFLWAFGDQYGNPEKAHRNAMKAGGGETRASLR